MGEGLKMPISAVLNYDIKFLLGSTLTKSKYSLTNILSRKAKRTEE